MFCLRHLNGIIVILSISHLASADVERQMLYVYRMGHMTFVSLRFSRKQVFMDIVPLCCQPPVCYWVR